MIAIIGTSDRPCWLAEACKILLLLQQSQTAMPRRQQHDYNKLLDAARNNSSYLSFLANGV